MTYTPGVPKGDYCLIGEEHERCRAVECECDCHVLAVSESDK